MVISSEVKTSLPRDTNQKQPCTAALVMGTNYRALGLVRSLGRRGIPVWVLKQDSHMLAGLSRYTCRALPWPPGDDSSRIEYLLSLAVKYQLGGALLLPTDDEGVIFIAQNHARLSQQFSLTTPPWDALRWAFDKRLMYQLAQDISIHQPRTFFPDNRLELRSIECPFPAIIKPAMRVELNQLTIDKAWQVHDRESLLARYDKACSLLSPDLLMIQEFLPGGGESQFSYVALCDDGHPVASLTAKRLRQFPMDFGRFSTFVESVEEPGVVAPAVRLLNALRYTGLVEVEFKHDPRDGQYKLLDVNTRVWGWHTLCGRAGVDLPYLLWLQVQGQHVPEVHARAGTRWVRMGADFSTALLEVMRGRLPLRSYLRSIRGGLEWAIFAADDPMPFVGQFPALIYLLAKRALSKLSKRKKRV
jgi:D-aspartate ligase